MATIIRDAGYGRPARDHSLGIGRLARVIRCAKWLFVVCAVSLLAMLLIRMFVPDSIMGPVPNYARMLLIQWFVELLLWYGFLSQADTLMGSLLKEGAPDYRLWARSFRILALLFLGVACAAWLFSAIAAGVSAQTPLSLSLGFEFSSFPTPSEWATVFNEGEGTLEVVHSSVDLFSLLCSGVLWVVSVVMERAERLEYNEEHTI